MPLIKSDDLVKRILPTSTKLPDNEQEWVVIDPSPIMGGDLANIEGFKNVIDLVAKVLPHRIAEWNVRGYDGEIAEINDDNIRHLPVEDLTFLMQELKAEAGSAGLPKAPETDSKPI